MPSSLYVHTSAVGDLPLIVRVLEGCARELLGSPSDASVVKIDRRRPRVAYLEYPEFDTDPHPALRGASVASLDTQQTNFVYYGDRANPPILHRKETLVSDSYPLRSKFASLTRAEERAGLLEQPSAIGMKRAWDERLFRQGFALRGHQLRRSQN